MRFSFFGGRFGGGFGWCLRWGTGARGEGECEGGVAAAAASTEGAAEAAVPKPNYTYYKEFVRVVDAKSVAVNIDLGFGVWRHNQNLDLQGLP